MLPSVGTSALQTLNHRDNRRRWIYLYQHDSCEFEICPAKQCQEKWAIMIERSLS